MTIPNPGSDEAIADGCICAVLDNNHGLFAPYPDDGWWITEGCRVHCPADQVTPERKLEDVLRDDYPPDDAS
jgi:hypothetical protein